ncbi:hypothetical protein DRQ09_09385 [candidate division KSB1 bacterium]|nr:MAG: hypothetical protein DRQ09_09385 [candidate division KSB1 bacterium]
MCLAVPMRLIKFEGVNGIAEIDGVKRNVNLSFIENPEIGDYLIIHAGFAIQKLDEKEAMENIRLIKEMWEMQ